MTTIRPSQVMTIAAVATVVVIGISEPPRANWVAVGAALHLCGLGLVVVSGWARQVNLAQYGFLGVGAYAAAAAEGLPFPVRFAIATAAAAAVAVPVGLAASRLAGLALGALTLVVGLTVWSLARAPEVMRHIGGDTFSGATITRPAAFAGDRAYGILTLVVVGVATVAVLALRRSRTGMALHALRVGGPALSSMGVESRRLVIGAFALSAALAGMGGVLLGAGMGGVNANDIVPFNSIVLYAFLFNAGSRRPAAAALTAALVPVTLALQLPAWLLPLVGGAGLIYAGASLPDGYLETTDATLRRLVVR